MFKAFFSMMQSPDEKVVASSATAEKSSAKNPTHGDVKRWIRSSHRCLSTTASASW